MTNNDKLSLFSPKNLQNTALIIAILASLMGGLAFWFHLKPISQNDMSWKFKRNIGIAEQPIGWEKEKQEEQAK